MENQNKKFNSTNFILRIILDIFLLCGGVYTFSLGLSDALRESRGGLPMAVGSILIALFFLIRLWRKEYRERNSQK